MRKWKSITIKQNLMEIGFFSCLSTMGDEIKLICGWVDVDDVFSQKFSRKDKSRSEYIRTSFHLKAHFCAAIWYSDLCFFFSLWIEFILLTGCLQGKKLESEKLQHIFVVHAISDYYILFLFSCSPIFLLFLVCAFFAAFLLNCDRIMKL